MKQHHSTRALSLYLSLSLFFISCGSKEPTIKVTGQDGRVFSSYQEACAAQDFTAAHQYLAVLKSTADSYHGKGGSRNYDKYLHYIGLFNEGEAYVYKNEALFLMTMDDDDFITKRLMFLLKEAGDEGNDSRCNMLVDLAIDMDKEGIVKALTKMYKNGIPASELSKITEYLYVQKGDGNLEFVKSLLNRNGKGELIMDAAILKDNVPLVVESAGLVTGEISFSDFMKVMDFLKGRGSKDYQRVCNLLAPKVDDKSGMLDYALATKQVALAKQLLQSYGTINIYDKKMIAKLAAVNDKSISDKIILELAERGNSVPPMPSISGYLRSSYSGKMDRETDHGNYNDAAKAFNSDCKSIMNIAIANKNLYLAKTAISKMKRTLTFQNVGSWQIADHTYNGTSLYAYKASTSREDINAAQKALNEAISSGSFK